MIYFIYDFFVNQNNKMVGGSGLARIPSAILS
jgi:hypothetical protein